MKHSQLGELPNVAIPGLCFTGARVPPVGDDYLWATGKTYFFSYKLKCWALRISWLGAFGLLAIFFRPQACYTSQ